MKWISFHSGYDYGYLFKLVSQESLPDQEAEFFDLLKLYFPHIYDIKYLMKSCENLSGGLQKVAEKLSLDRIGQQHQAGSDALLTAATFFKMREYYFDNAIDDAKYLNILFGLGQNISVMPSISTTASATSNFSQSAAQPPALLPTPLNDQSVSASAAKKRLQTSRSLTFNTAPPTPPRWDD